MIVDASVLVKLLSVEEDSDRAQRLMETEIVSAPEMIFAEACNALWLKGRRGDAVPEPQVIHRTAKLFSRLVPALELMELALELALALRHPAYDCFYLALAIQSDDRLVTADGRFIKAASASRYADRMIALADWRG